MHTFLQEPPRLGNQLHHDRVLRSYLARVLPPDVRREVEPSLAALTAEVERAAAAARQVPALAAPAAAAQEAVVHASGWLRRAAADGRDAVEAGARRFALTLGRAAELALLAEHAAWSMETEGDSRAAAAARRLALAGIDRIAATDRRDARALGNDEPLPVEPPVERATAD